MSIVLIIAIVLFAVGCVFAVLKREQSPLFYVVTAAVVLYIFGGMA